MTDGQSRTLKERSKKRFKDTKQWLTKPFSRHQSRLTSPQPSATTQQGHHPPTQLSRSQSSSSSSAPSRSAVAHSQHETPPPVGHAPISPPQPHGTIGNLSETPGDTEKPTSNVQSAVKDYAGVAFRFTTTLLKRLPEVVDTNPAKIVLGIAKIVLEIKEAVKDNIDAVDRRIISTVDQLREVERALAGWKPKKEDKRGVEVFTTTLAKELDKLFKLQKQSLARTIADHEKDQGQIAEIFECINQAREQLVLVTGLTVHKTVLAIQGDLVRLLLRELEPSHTADHKFELEGEKRQLLRRAVCTPGTRVRILGDITRWANDTSLESQSVYWLFGLAGSGKSTIAYTIARRFELAVDADDTIVLGGNFFCSRQLDETKFAKRIIRTIVYHLALRYKEFADALRDCGNFDTAHHNVSSQFKSLLIEPWEKALLADPSKSPRFLVVIDALDEIDGDGSSGFLRDLLNIINKRRLQGLKFFVTSRPDPDLLTHLGSFEDKQLYRLHQVPIGEAQADITTYLKDNLPHFADEPEMEKLVEQAAGLFIYAATVVKYLKGYEPLEQMMRLDKLPLVSNSALPQTSPQTLEVETLLLDGLYLQVLSDALGSFKGDQFTDRLHILHTFLCSVERTSTSVVAELLFRLNKNKTNPAFSPTKIVDRVLTSLYAVLYTENDKVLSYHKSFTDFMFDQNRAKEFWCDRAKHHRLLADSCFRVMDGLKFNIANIPSSFLLDCDNSDLPEAVKQNISPALSYSCRTWAQHLSAVASADSATLRGTLSEFLQLRVLFWIEAMNLLGSPGPCKRMLERASEWVTNDDSLEKDLAEAASFAQYFSLSEASLSTPHLYISALATWPRDLGPCRAWRSHFPRIPGFTIALQSNAKRLMTLESVVWAVACSSDNRCIAFGSADKLVRLWDAEAGKMLRVLEGHTEDVTSVAFLSNDTIVSGSWDKSVRVWDAETGKTLKVLEGHTGHVTSVAFSSNGMCIISGSADKSVRVWDAETGETLKVLEGHTEDVTSVAFSSNDMCIVSGSADKSVRVWNAGTGETLKVLEGHTEDVTSVAFSSDDGCIVSGSADKSVRVWDAEMGKMLRVLEGHAGRVTSVAFSSNDTCIVSGSADKSVRVWDAEMGKTLSVLEGHTEDVTSVAFSSNDGCIISGSVDKSVRVWKPEMGGTLKVLEGHTGHVTSVAFSSNDGCIIPGSVDKSVRVLTVLEDYTLYVTPVAFANKGIRMVFATADKSVRVLSSGLYTKVVKVLKGHTGRVTSVAFSSDDKRIVSGSVENSVRVWDIATGKMLMVLEGHTGHVTSVAFSRDDRYIASGSVDKSVRVWDAKTGEMLKVLEGHTEPVTSAVFSMDDTHVTSGSNDKLESAWALSQNQISLTHLRQKAAHHRRHTGWLFSPERGHYLMLVPLSAGYDLMLPFLRSLGDYATSVDFTSSALGPDWYNCFSP